MEKIAVFVNDAAYARHILQPLLSGESPVHWIVVACPPTLSRHIGRWVSHGAREQWRQRWAAECFAEVEPELRANPRNKVEKLLANRPPMEMASRLEARLGAGLCCCQRFFGPAHPPAGGQGRRTSDSSTAQHQAGLDLADRRDDRVECNAVTGGLTSGPARRPAAAPPLHAGQPAGAQLSAPAPRLRARQGAPLRPCRAPPDSGVSSPAGLVRAPIQGTILSLDELQHGLSPKPQNPRP
jgi:hypothetical protein